ncbi:MAG: hypothetical protein WCR01_11070 [Bacteroidota bacterium]
MENIIDDAAVIAAQDREKLKQLLSNKPTAVRNTILSLFDQAINTVEPGADIVSVLGQSHIKTKRDLAGALTKAGCRFGTPEYDQFYDRFCAAHPDLSI